MNARQQTTLWVMQRATAAVLAPIVLIHIGTIIYAVHHGLSATAILARTRGNLGWLMFYSLFAGAAAIHGPIGLRTVIHEMTSWRGPVLDSFLVVLGVFMAFAGFRAAYSLFS
ncbi:MAG: succinate dehydrogenase [Acidiferrobacteraceae bacterium]